MRGTKTFNQLRFVFHQRKPPVVEHAHAVHGVLDDFAQERNHVGANFRVGVGEAGRALTQSVYTAPLGPPPVDRVAVIEVIQRRRVVEAGDAIAGVKFETDLACVLSGDL